MQNPNKNSLKSAPFNAFLISDSLSAIGYIGGRLPERSKKRCDVNSRFCHCPSDNFCKSQARKQKKDKIHVRKVNIRISDRVIFVKQLTYVSLIFQ